MKRSLLCIFLIATLAGCQNSDKQLQLELRRSFKNFVASVDELHVEGLGISVYFPQVSDAKEHVQKLRLAYLEDLYQGRPLTFDPQGVVLVRFLGLLRQNYQILKVEPLDERDLRMRISVNFSYDQMMRAARYEKGTKVWVPGKPWGTFYEIVIGEPAPAPRDQLTYVEIEVVFRKTNSEGYWQVRTCQADEASMKFETTIETDFYTE